MANPVKAQPDNYHTVTPYLHIKGAAAAIDFYKNAFGATETVRMPFPDGRVGHAEIRVGDSCVMLADEFPEGRVSPPEQWAIPTVSLLLYVDDVDAVFNKAISLGGKVNKPVADQFYGDRSGTVEDPFGHLWTIATHKEEVTPEEMKRRMDAMAKK